MEELDRVFESLQADSDQLEQQHQKLASTSSAAHRDKEIRAGSLPPKYQPPPPASASSSSTAEPKYATDPRRQLENDTGTGLRNGLQPPELNRPVQQQQQQQQQHRDRESESAFDSETETGSTGGGGGQEGAFISSYVPNDRKGLGKKYGAFTFGLPTTPIVLKSVASPPPKRRDSRTEREPAHYTVSDSESQPVSPVLCH